MCRVRGPVSESGVLAASWFVSGVCLAAFGPRSGGSFIHRGIVSSEPRHPLSPFQLAIG